MDMLARMQQDLGVDRVWVMYDNTKETVTPTMVDAVTTNRLIIHTEDVCRAQNPFHENVWSHVDTPLATAYHALQHVGFDFVWLIENDVYCDGSFRSAFDRARGAGHDFLAAHLEEYNEANRDWYWFPSLVGEISAAVPLHERVKSYFPITRYSKRMLQCIADNLGRSGGFCECYIPMLARWQGLTYATLPESMIGDLTTEHRGWTLTPQTLPHETNDVFWHKYYY